MADEPLNNANSCLGWIQEAVLCSTHRETNDSLNVFVMKPEKRSPVSCLGFAQFVPNEAVNA